MIPVRFLVSNFHNMVLEGKNVSSSTVSVIFVDLFNGNYSNLNDKQFVDEREQRIFAFCGFYEDPVTKISLI